MSMTILIPGFGETYGSAEPLANELRYGEFAIYDELDILPVADAIAVLGRKSHVFKNNKLVTHSAGILPEFVAQEYVSLNGPEPTSLRGTQAGTQKVSKVTDSDMEPGIKPLGKFKQGLDIACHPIVNASIPWAIRKFSTVDALIQRTQGTGARAEMFVATQDDFGFYRQQAVDKALKNGIGVHVYDGRHNDVMLKPRQMAKFIFDRYSER